MAALSHLAAALALALAQAPAPPAAIPPAPQFASLLSGEALGVGTTQLLVAAGAPSLSVLYAQGLSDATDLGAFVEADWTRTEILAGAFFRTALWRSRESRLALRARGALYADLGSTWAYDGNRGDTGVQMAPGLALSSPAGRVLLSLAVDVPVTLTFARGTGWILAPRVAVGLEAPLYGDLMIGARLGGGPRWARGGAPLSGDSPQAWFELAAVLTWRVF